MAKFNFIFNATILFFALLVGCVKAQKQEAPSEGSQRLFRLSKTEPLVDVTGYAPNGIRSSDVSATRIGEPSVKSAKARYNDRVEYALKMCNLNDMRTGNTLLGQKLRVYSELNILNDILVIQSDDCVSWQVSIPYNYFAEAVNLEINFIFKTLSGQKSFIHKKVLLSPWDSRRGKNPEFFDFTRVGLSPEILSLAWARGIDEIELALRGELIKSDIKLEIGSVNIAALQKNNKNFVDANVVGSKVIKSFEKENELLKEKLTSSSRLETLDLHLNMRLGNLRVRLLDTAGNNKDEELTTGLYKIFAQIVATDQADKGHWIISDKILISEMKDWESTTMGVNAVLPLSIPVRSQWGNLNLLLKVVPVNIPDVLAFEGLYHLGRFNDISGGKSPLFDTSEHSIDSKGSITFSYDEYLKKAENYDKWEKKITTDFSDVSTLQKGFRRFLFSNLNIQFGRVVPGETATDRTIQYTVETCLTDNFTGAAVGEGLKFSVDVDDRGQNLPTQELLTDRLGCLNWFGNISHKFYHREKLILNNSKLTYIGEDSDKPKYKLDYYINPWDVDFMFARDARLLSDEYLKQIHETQEKAPATRILITDFSYDTTGYRYDIDKYMNMTVKKTVLLNLKPKILKHNSIAIGRNKIIDIRDGVYLLKVALQKEYMDPLANKGLLIGYNDKLSKNESRPLKISSSRAAPLSTADLENINKKQLLVVKETLVRVLGGTVITPVEFDVQDLRTMRIRSQFFIQLETIDEHKLRALLYPQATKKEVSSSYDPFAEKENMQNSMNELLLKIRSQIEKNEKDIVRKLEDEKRMECQLLMADLLARGFKTEAELYNPDHANEEGYLCKTFIPKEELFSYITTNHSRAMDEMFQSRLTPAEFALYKTYFLREKTIAFDLNSLVNSGDEKFIDSDNKQARKSLNGKIVSDDSVSGLPKRTFIGPVTFVLNNASGPLRPTDVLSTVGCHGNCEAFQDVERLMTNSTRVAQEEVKKFGLSPDTSFDESPYFGSIEHFFNVHVDELKVVETALKKEYQEEMQAFSQVGNFLDSYLLTYVSFGEKQSHVRKLNYSCYAKWKSVLETSYQKWREDKNHKISVESIPPFCYENSGRVITKDKFKKIGDEPIADTGMSTMNKSLSKYVDFDIPMETFTEFSKNGLMSEKLSLNDKVLVLHKMCYLLRKQLYPQTKEFEQEIKKRNKAGNLDGYLHGTSTFKSAGVKSVQLDCHKNVELFQKDLNKLIAAEKNPKIINSLIVARARTLPLVVERRVRVLENTNRSLYKDGQTLGYSTNVGFSTSHSMGVNRGYKVDPVSLIGKLAGAAGGVLGAVGGLINFDWGVGESLSVSDGVSVGEGVGLSAQVSTLDIELKSWEKCVVVRYDAEFITSAIDKHLSSNIFDPSKDIQGLGYFMCSGDKTSGKEIKTDDLNPGQPLRVRERYFYLTQNFDELGMQDPGSLANYPWMMQMRGLRDFGQFEKRLKAPQKDVNWTSPWSLMSRDLYSAATLGSEQRLNDRSSMEVVSREDVAKSLQIMSHSFSNVLPAFPGMYTFSDSPFDTVIGWPEK